MKFKTQIKKLGIEDEVKSIVENCKCGEINGKRLVELSKLRKWEIIEEIGNYLDPQGQEVEDWDDIKRIETFCKAFDINPKNLTSYYASAICEGGYEIAYAINEDVVLIIE